MNKSKIISYVSRQDACFWYRNKMPLEALARKGWDASTLNMGDMMQLDNVEMVQFSRVYTTQFETFLYMLKERGIKIWYDIDDAVDLVKPFNPFAPANRQHMSAFYFLLNQADFITTTTPFLKEHLSKMTPKPIHVFGNYINPTEWKERPRENTALRVGFAGSPSHVKEVNDILPVIRDLQKRHAFTFVMFGMGNGANAEEWIAGEREKYKDVWDTDEYCKEVERMVTLLKDINYEWHAPCRWEVYPKRLAKLDLDIGLCPLADDDFNRCKSAIKLYEYAITGTVTLASNVTPFKEEALAVTDNDYQSWYDALDALLMHRELRDKTLEVQREYVLGSRTIDENIEPLEEILSTYAKQQ